MNKKEIQKRVLQNGAPLDLSKFTWCEDTKTFSSKESNLVIDFSGINYCTFNTGYSCTFNTGSECVIVRRDVFDVIQPKNGETIQLFPCGVKGHLTNSVYKGKPHIIVDEIVSEIISQRGDVLRVINLGEEKKSYIVKSGDVYSHGSTLKEAREGLLYKFSNRDRSEYEGLTLDSKVSHEDSIQMYHTITGACSSGIRYFIEGNKNKVSKKYTIEQLIDLTKGQYGHQEFVSFFNKGLK